MRKDIHPENYRLVAFKEKFQEHHILFILVSLN